MLKGLLCLLLPFVYMAIIIPIGFLLRVANKRLIPLSYDLELHSYWVDQRPQKITANDFSNTL